MLAWQPLLNCGAFHGFGNGCDGGDPIGVCEWTPQASASVRLPGCVPNLYYNGMGKRLVSDS